MSATVAAALKKIAVAILSDKKARKTVFTIILVILLVILMPFFAIIALLNGNLSFDTDELVTAIEAQLTSEDIALLTQIEDTMDAIEVAMKNAGLPGKAAEAQALYIMALYNYSSSGDFISRLTGCFQEGQTDAELIDRVNSEFGTSISVEEFSRIADMVSTIPTTPTTTPAA